jgi:hypothetical protein
MVLSLHYQLVNISGIWIGIVNIFWKILTKKIILKVKEKKLNSLKSWKFWNQKVSPDVGRIEPEIGDVVLDAGPVVEVNLKNSQS